VELREAIDYIVSGTFWHQQKDLFRPPIDSLLNHQLQPHNRSFANNI
jgi:hypothetical protein